MPSRVDKAAQVENALTNVYISLFKEIKKDPNYPNLISEVKRKFNRQAYDATRAAIAEVYNEGVKYVNTKLKTDPYLTTQDVINQREQTDKAITAFWKRIQNDATRTIQQETTLIIDPKPSFNTPALLNSIAAFASFASLASATRSKAKQIVQPVTEETEGGQTLEFDVGFEIKRIPRLKWITQHDERVCPICRELDGKTWFEDDPDLPAPPDDSHNNCRCYLELVE